jgi:hypothetical protein
MLPDGNMSPAGRAPPGPRLPSTPMDLSPELEIAKVRCAPFHEALGVDPIGSAGAYDAFLMVEVPLPWDRDVSTNEPFRSLLELVGAKALGPDGRRWRPQAVVRARDAEQVRVTAYEQDPTAGAPRGPYRRREWDVPAADLLALCRALVEADAAELAVFDERLADVAAGVVDLYVCTHGRRDACCGHWGAELYGELADAALAGVRVRRTSHTGGHRFAPTALSFPDGYAWAHLDATLVATLLDAAADPTPLLGHCRGSSAVAGGPAQAADREAFARVGRDWLGASRRLTVVGFDRTTMTTTMHVDATTAAGARLELRVEVALDHHVPQTTCGVIAGPEYTVEPVRRVVSVEVA